MNQLFLPMDLEELIPDNHVVRVGNEAIEKLDDSIFEKYYPGGGRNSYHPKLMMKIIIYGYTQRLYSSRQIAKAVRESIPFMWLSARQTPDFRTINRFRSERMTEVIDEVFSAVLQLLIEEGFVKLEHYFLDGTKIEANANRYTFVWKKSTDKHQEKLQTKIRELLHEIDEAEKNEQAVYDDQDLEELGENCTITAEKLEEVVSRLEQKLEEEPKNKPLKKAVKKIRKDFLPRCAKYEEQQGTFGDRNSYSKTDHDVTFMRMKEDHMRNGQLKPAYNVQIGTENQFIVGYSLHQRPTDTRCLIGHLKQLKDKLGTLPKAVIADAGYGSEENFAFLEEEKLDAYVKFNSFYQEQTRKFTNDISRVENWTYDHEHDEYICPWNQRLAFRYEGKKKTDTGYVVTKRYYECQACGDCPFKQACTKAKGNRKISVSVALQKFKQKARENLWSEQGRQLSIRRMVEVESVFGQFQVNRSFRRFFLRGLTKVNIEVGLLSLAHNLLKKAAVMGKKEPELAG
jgi:transposase